MSTLYVIGEFFHNWESQVNFAAAKDLTTALADTAPRGLSSALLVATDTVAPNFENPKARAEIMALRSSMLPLIWHSNQAARPLDGEYVHSFSPLIPLRTRDEDDGSQSSVMISHTLAWDAPEMLPKSQARSYRAFTRRALKHADVIVAPSHTVAKRLKEIYGRAISPRVLPLAAPRAYIAGSNAKAVLEELEVKKDYILTFANLTETARLKWVLDAYRADESLPQLVIIDEHGDLNLSEYSDLNERVTVLKDLPLPKIGALINGALALAMPESAGDLYYPVYAALEQGVPVIHADNSGIAEITLDGAVSASDEASFSDTLKKIASDKAFRERVSILAKDRSRAFSWKQTAWTLWEIHANI